MPNHVDSVSSEISAAFAAHSRGDYVKVENDVDYHMFWCPGRKINAEGDRLPAVLTRGSYGFPDPEQEGKGKDGGDKVVYFNCPKAVDHNAQCHCHDVLIAKAKASPDPLRRKQADRLKGGFGGGAYLKTFIQVIVINDGMKVGICMLTQGIGSRVHKADTQWHKESGYHICDWQGGVPFGFRKAETDKGVRYFQLPFTGTEGPQGVKLLNEVYGVGIMGILTQAGIGDLKVITNQLVDLRKIKDVQYPSDKWLDDHLGAFLGVSTATMIQNPLAGLGDSLAENAIEETFEETPAIQPAIQPAAQAALKTPATPAVLEEDTLDDSPAAEPPEELPEDATPVAPPAAQTSSPAPSGDGAKLSEDEELDRLLNEELDKNPSAAAEA